MLHLLLPLALAAPHPGEPDSLAPDRNWDLEHLHLDLAIDMDNESIQGKAVLDFRPLTPGSTTLWVHQVGLEVSEVRLNGEVVSYRLGDTDLRVEADPNQPAQLEIHYSAKPQNGLHFRKVTRESPDTYNEVFSQGEDTDNRYWFPSWDYPNDRFTYTGRFEAPQGYKVLSNGLGGFDGEAWSYKLEQDMVNYLVMLAVAPYKERLDAWRGQPVRQWYPPDVSEAAVEHVSGKVPEMLELFSQLTAFDYPYPIYTEVFVQRFLYAGMENTTATVEEKMLLKEPAEGDLAQGSQSVVAHEAAHQWFGDLLTCKTWHELWLNEGFATFFASLWEREEYGVANWYSDVNRWYSRALNAGPMSGRWWSTEDGKHAERTSVYMRGAATLQMLHVLFGEDAFWAAIRKYVADNAHSLVETDDLRAAFEAITGQHLGWFFDQWTHLPGSPTVSVSHRWQGNQLRIDVKQEGDRLFAFPLDVEIGTDRGPVTQREWMTEKTLRFTVPLEDAPLYVAVDPQAGVLAQFKNQQPTENWIAQLKSSSPAARFAAMEALGEKPSTDAIAKALRGILEHQEEERPYREKAARVLGKLDHTIGDKALIATLMTAESPRLRSTIASALGQGRAHHNEARILRQVANSDPRHAVRGSALRSLAHFDRQSALRIARGILKRPAYPNLSLHKSAARVLRSHGNASDLDLLLRHMDRSDPSQLASHNLWQALGLFSSLDEDEIEEAREKVADQIVLWLDSRDLRLRRAAIYGLKSTGSNEHIAALKSLQAHTTLPKLRESAQEAIEGIRIRREDPKPEGSDVVDELQALSDRIEALEKALEEENSRH